MESRQALPTVSGTLVRYLVIGGGALVMVGLLLAAPAFACGPSTSASANPSHAVAGSSVNVFGNAFAANLPIEIRWGGADGTLLASGTASGEGSYAASVTVPADAGVGTHTMWVGQPVEGGRSFAFNFAVVAPVEEPAPAPEPAPDPVDTTDPEPEPAPDPVDTTNPEPEPAPDPVDTTNPEPAPAPDPVDTTNPEPAPAPAPGQPVNLGSLPAAAPAVGAQSPETAAPAPAPARAADTAPAAPAPTSTTTRSQLATSPAPSSEAPSSEAPPASESAPERELVGADAAEAYSPSTTERSLLAGAGIVATPEVSTAPAEPSAAAETAPSQSDTAASPVDAGGTTPWALVPLMLLAAGLLAASGAALTTEVRQRAKAKAKA